jgi:hypothetical protein
MDGPSGPRRICGRTPAGFEVFLDRDDYASGDDWKKVGVWTLWRTGQLILVGSAAAAKSAPVFREVEIFSKTGRRIVPIDFAGSLDSTEAPSPLAPLLPPETLRIKESAERLRTGPSDESVATIRRTFNLLRQDKKRARVFAAIALILATLTIAVGLAWRQAAQQRDRAENTLKDATSSANMFVVDIADKLRNAAGLPLACMDAGARIRNYTLRAIDGIAASPEDDLNLFSANGTPGANLPRLLEPGAGHHWRKASSWRHPHKQRTAD